MQHSLSYYLTLLVIRLKGLKNTFSEDPVDYGKLRKEDVLLPKGSFFKKNIQSRFKVLNSTIIEVSTATNPDKLLILIHGGAFISGPAQHHWDTIKTIAKNTNYKIWVCDYPKAPEHNIVEISQNIDTIYQRALEEFKADHIVLMGDSVGGTLATTLTQRLIQNSIDVPQKIFLVCPVMDASMTNSAIPEVDSKDPMLSKEGILSAKRMCAGEKDLKDPLISPLYGDFDKFPKTIFYAAENDIMYPDQLLAFDKLKKSNVEIQSIIGNKMPHIWPFLPVMKEAKLALKTIITELNQS